MFLTNKSQKEKLVFSLFADCIITKGASRSIICDLKRNKFDFIPNSLQYILANFKDHSIRKVKKIFKNERDNFIDEYFNFLEENEYIFYCTVTEKKSFPSIDLSFDFPGTITNCIIDVDKYSTHDFKNISQELREVQAYFIDVRIYDVFTFARLNSILKSLSSPETNIHLIIPYHKTLNKENVHYIIIKYGISAITMYDLPKKLEENYSELKMYNFFSSSSTIKNQLSCGKISPSYFAINIETITESKHYNSCLNRKISIDTNGEIKNCPSLKKSYGNIKNVKLIDVLNKQGFKDLWNIKKDQIDICKDCEFRYICTDCRAYIEDPKDILSKPLKCGYSPYTTAWEEWSKNPLKQKAINYYGMNEFLDSV